MYLLNISSKLLILQAKMIMQETKKIVSSRTDIFIKPDDLVSVSRTNTCLQSNYNDSFRDETLLLPKMFFITSAK